METTVIEAGVDYITGTTQEEKTFSTVYDNNIELWSSLLLKSEEHQGNEIKPWGMEGYTGFKCGGVQIGRREDGWIYRLSGGLAAAKWRDVFKRSTNITRLDAQVTVRFPHNRINVVEAHEQEAIEHIKAGGRRAKVRLIREHDGGSTLYIGSRLSDKIGRVYAKEFESKLEHYRNSYRYELELHKRLAMSYGSKIAHHHSEVTAVRDLVHQHFAKRGLTCLWAAMPLTVAQSPRKPSDRHQKLRWLATQVRPTVEWAKTHGCLRETLEALNISHADLVSLGMCTKPTTAEEGGS